MSRYTPEELEAAGLTESELAAINGEEHDADALADLAGDDDDDDDDGTDADDGGDADNGDDGSDDTTDAAGKGAGDGAQPQNSPADDDDEDEGLPVYRAAAPADADARLAAADSKEADAFSKLMDGEITAEEYQKEKNEAQAEREAVREAQLKATIAQEMSEQASRAAWDRACEKFLSKTKADEGIDYAGNALLGQAFDTAVRALAAKPENASKPSSFFLAEAHKQVKQAFGHAPARAPAAAPAPAARQRPAVDRSTIPPTLGGLPPAQEAVVGEDEFAHLRGLKGNDYERAIAGMTPAQLDRFMAS